MIRKRQPTVPPAEEVLSAQASAYSQLPAASVDAASLRQLLLAALLAGRSLLPSLLAQQRQRLRTVLLPLPCAVPAEQPLPAPPPLLPPDGAGPEAAGRRALSEAAQMSVTALRAGGLLHHCCLGYLVQLRAACRAHDAEKVRADEAG